MLGSFIRELESGNTVAPTECGQVLLWLKELEERRKEEVGHDFVELLNCVRLEREQNAASQIIVGFATVVERRVESLMEKVKNLIGLEINVP